ncbi:effector-associated constant component EACC1 [Streptomyces sp. BBFR109]|uniref:effector-associated constant component EACC1 n=1 Tax=Streptomyces sp. BBFR109 TaxID=3448172 RepID=UPI003F763548
MDERLVVEVVGDRSADELRSLRDWLVAEEELRGRVRLESPPPEPGALGSVVEALTIALGPGGVATAAASVLISWLRRRTGDISLKATWPDGTSTELNVTNVKGLDVTEVQRMTAELSRSLAPADDRDIGDAS